MGTAPGPARAPALYPSASAGPEFVAASSGLAPDAVSKAGPVFVCHRRCAGYQTPDVYPPDLRDRFSLLNPFEHTGARAYKHIKFVEPGDDYPAAVAMVMAQPEVAYLHVRSATAQCFTFEVRPRLAAAGHR